MEVTRFSQLSNFAAAAAPWLIQREVDNNLILGLLTDIVSHPERYQQQPYMAVVEQEGTLAGAALMTPPHNLILAQDTVPEALDALIRDLAVVFPALPGVNGPAPISSEFVTRWSKQQGVSYRKHRGLRIYKLSRVNAPPTVPGEMRRATEADRELLYAWLAAFEQEALGEHHPASLQQRIDGFLHSTVRGLYFWQTTEPVAIAGYSGPTPNSIRIVAVYTPPEQRRRGYASALVAALSQHLLDSGRQFCTLYTDLANPTSNHTYQELGYEPVCDVDEYRFGYT